VVGPHVRPAVEGEFPSAVSIRSSGRAHCTGTLVAPQLVITAAHCVSTGNVGFLKVHVGLGTEPDFSERGVAVASFGTSPAYQRDIGGNSDVAYLVLAQPLDNVPITPVATDPEELRTLLATGTRSTLVGYGVHDNDVSGSSGVKYLGPGTVKFFSRNEVWIGDAQGDGCSGDSGGPVFGQLPSGEWRVFGVTSRGPSPCGLEEWPGIWGLMHAHACWIEQASGIEIPSSTLDCAATASPDPSVQTDFTDLAAVCADATLPAATRRTVEALKVVYAERSQRVDDRASDVSCGELADWAATETRLDLSKLLLSDLRPLRAFKSLASLNVEDNVITDPTPLASGFDSLQVLRIGWNDVPSFAALDDRAASGLHIRGRGVQSVTPDFTTQVFETQCNAATQPEAPEDARRNFEILRKHLCYNRLCPCYLAAKNLRSIRVMDLGGSAITSLEPLRGAAGVQYLKISDTQLTDVAALADVENLKFVDISGARVTDTSVLQPLVEDNALQVVGEAERSDAPLTRLSTTKSDLSLLVPEAVEAGQAAVVPLELTGAGTIQSIAVHLQLEHAAPNELIVRLVHPSGKHVVVARRPSGLGPNFTARFAFGQEGTVARDLRALKRLPAAGSWKLLVHDTYSGNSGKLVGVTLDVDAVQP
jgi:subtilisin-like proprotein convertase family protein/V8-like Glu-specific endopeptidase